MKKKTVFSICAIGIIALLSLSCISAEDGDMDNWTDISVKNVSFKIPPEFAGGNSSGGNYVLTNVFNFGLVGLETEKSLRNNYGYESTLDELYDAEELEIDGHHAVAYYSHRSIVDHDVVYLYFESNKTFYALSYDGDDVNDTMKKIVASSPESAFSKEKFDAKLNKAQDDYIEAQTEYGEYYAYEQGYNTGYSQGSHNRGNDLFGYYIFYRLGQRSR